MFDDIWTEGYDKYGSQIGIDVLPDIVAREEWTSASATQAAATLAAPLGADADPDGRSVRFNFGNPGSITKTFPANYARIIESFFYLRDSATTGDWCIDWLDGATVQCRLVFQAATGKLLLYRGAATTLLHTSTEAIGSSVVTITYDITLSNTAGIMKLWINGVLTSINLSGLDLCSTANDYCNAIRFQYSSGSAVGFWIDHHYRMRFLAGGSADAPFPGSPYIDTDFVDAETATSDFVPGRWMVGPTEYDGAAKGNKDSGNAGLNQIIMRRVQAPCNGQIDAVFYKPNTANNSIPVVYADSAGSPGALLGSGPQYTPGAAGYVQQRAPLTTPVAVVKDSYYWVGVSVGTNNAVAFISDANAGHIGSVSKAQTFGNALPDPFGTPGVAAANDYWIMADITGGGAEANNAKLLGAIRPRAESYVQATGSGKTEKLTFPPLRNNPNAIHLVALKALLASTAAETATLQLEDDVAGSGNKATHTPGASLAYRSTYFTTDPDTGAAWSKTGVDEALGVVKIN